MKPIQKEELYKHLSQFLKSKGVELTEGSYTRGIHAGCSLLADAINLSQAGFERAKAGLDKRLDQVRQVIHDKTAPKKPSPGSARSGKNGRPGAKVQKAAPPKAARARKRSNRKR